MFYNVNNSRKALMIGLALLVSTEGAQAATYSDVSDKCYRAVPVELNDSVRAYADEPGGSVFSLDVPAAGIASLEVSVSASQTLQPRLGFLGQSCDTVSIDPAYATVERSATHQVVAFRTAGRYFFRVGAEDPRRALSDFKLRTSFLETETVDREIDLGPATTAEHTDFYAAGTDPLLSIVTFRGVDGDSIQGHLVLIGHERGTTEAFYAALAAETMPFSPRPYGGDKSKEVEVDPDPNGIVPLPVGGEKSKEVEVDPDPNGIVPLPVGGEKSKEVEVDPDPNGYQPIPNGVVTFYTRNEYSYDPAATTAALPYGVDGLCRMSDDHGDTLSCATPIELDRVVAGEISHQQGEDDDVFRFTVSELETLRIRAAGNVETFGALYDRSGNRLGQANLDDSSLDMIRTLSPGHYFLRIEGRSGAEGVYRLKVEALQW